MKTSGKSIDYYVAVISPWAYLGHARFRAMTSAAGATVNLLPMDLGEVFPASGGLPLAKRAPQRQAYRLADLARFKAHLALPMNLQPKHFPTASALASQLVIVVNAQDGTDAGMALLDEVFKSTWEREQDIADAGVLAQALAHLGLAASRLDDAQTDAAKAQFASNTRAAIAAGVFGAPSYVIDGEVLWGQDRLDFVQRALAGTAPA